jgi:hypothetical protein
MINLHPGQSEVYRDLFVDQSCLYSALCTSRGWGKSYLASAAAVTAVFELLQLPKKVPNKDVYIVAPTHDQVTDIYYPIIQYDLGIEHFCIKSSRDLGKFVFANDTTLRLLSYESIERMRGKGAYFVVWDEVSSCKKGLSPKEAWEAVMLPCINTRWSPERAAFFGAKSPGRALAISTPKGFNHFYDMYNYRESDKRWKSYKFDYKQSPLLDVSEIELAKANMDPIQFASEYLADFKESGNSVFYCFDRTKHVRDDLEYFGDEEAVHVNIDFNVGLQCSSAFALRGAQIHILDEFKGHPDTETLASVLREKYRGHKIYAYPDPSGRARKTSAPVGQTDFSILSSAGIECLARSKAPPIVDSVNAVNRMLINANQQTNLFVHPRCKGVISSLERTKWTETNPDIAAIDKSEGIEHFSDGVRYGTEFLFPVNAGVTRHSRGFNF